MKKHLLAEAVSPLARVRYLSEPLHSILPRELYEVLVNHDIRQLMRFRQPTFGV